MFRMRSQPTIDGKKCNATKIATRTAQSGPDQIDAGRRFVAEHENFQAAMNNAIDLDSADLALRLVVNLPTPQTQTGYTLQLPVASTFALTGASDHPLYPVAVGVAAVQAAAHGDDETANARMEQSFEAARRLGDPDHSTENLALGVRMFLAFGRGAARAHRAGEWSDPANAERQLWAPHVGVAVSGQRQYASAVSVSPLPVTAHRLCDSARVAEK
jgi:hypothetical protein